MFIQIVVIEFIYFYFSLDMLLFECIRDLEEIFINLGFVGFEDTEVDDFQRFFERFFEQQFSVNGIDVKIIDLNRLFSLSEYEEMLERINIFKMNVEFVGQGKLIRYFLLFFKEWLLFLVSLELQVELFCFIGIFLEFRFIEFFKVSVFKLIRIFFLFICDFEKGIYW